MGGHLASGVAASPCALDGKRRCIHCMEGNCCYAGSKGLVLESVIQRYSGGKVSILGEVVVSVIVRERKNKRFI